MEFEYYYTFLDCLFTFLLLLFYMFLLGTLGYVMSEVEDGKPLSQVVRAAKSLGYTEPGKGLCSTGDFVHCSGKVKVNLNSSIGFKLFRTSLN